MWQVVTAQPSQWSSAHLAVEREFPASEIDDLLEALGKLTPQTARRMFPVQTRKANVQVPSLVPPAKKPVAPNTARPVSTTIPPHNATRVPSEVLNSFALPRKVQSARQTLLSPELRAQLNELRATILVAAKSQNLRTVLLCGADANDHAQQLTINLSQLLAEYERLKIAFIEVLPASSASHAASSRSQIDYTLQIRRTRQANLFEIASSRGTVQINDWLQNWEPQLVLSEMQKMFDLILISTPAITACPDVALLAAAVDGVVLVTTENVTSYASIEAAQRRLQTAQAKILGAVMHKQSDAPSKLAIVKAQVRELMNSFSSKNK